MRSITTLTLTLALALTACTADKGETETDTAATSNVTTTTGGGSTGGTTGEPGTTTTPTTTGATESGTTGEPGTTGAMTSSTSLTTTTEPGTTGGSTGGSTGGTTGGAADPYGACATNNDCEMGSFCINAAVTMDAVKGNFCSPACAGDVCPDPADGVVASQGAQCLFGADPMMPTNCAVVCEVGADDCGADSDCEDIGIPPQMGKTFGVCTHPA
jgi:hypothetical protein